MLVFNLGLEGLTIRAAVDRQFACDTLVLEPASCADEVIVGRLALDLGRRLVPSVAVFCATSDARNGKDALEGLKPGREEGIPTGLYAERERERERGNTSQEVGQRLRCWRDEQDLRGAPCVQANPPYPKSRVGCGLERSSDLKCAMCIGMRVPFFEG